jgi:hypothetical protein
MLRLLLEDDETRTRERLKRAFNMCQLYIWLPHLFITASSFVTMGLSDAFTW